MGSRVYDYIAAQEAKEPQVYSSQNPLKWPFPVLHGPGFYYEGLYEYCAAQRQGKNTLMQRDLMEKILLLYRPDQIWANYHIYIEGIHCLETDALINKAFELKEKEIRDQVFLFDESGQFLIARHSFNKTQTKFVLMSWQMPKMGWLLLYADNPGNSADAILRLATTVTILPRYYHGAQRMEDYIIADIIWDQDCLIERGRQLGGVAFYQRFFNTREPVK
jgi:hypothetical protein